MAAFHSQFKTSAKMCRNGTREDCPAGDRCRFQHSRPTHILYSSAPKGAVPPPPSPVTSPTRTHFPSTENGTRSWCGEQNITLSGTFDANALAQATDGLAIYRAWLESQVEVQKAKIQAMSKQYSIPIPQLNNNNNLDPFDFPPLRMIPAPMTNATAVTTMNNDFRGQRRSPPEVPSTPQAPRLEPAQLQSAPGYQYHRHEGPTPGANTKYAHENPDSATGGAPRKIDISYKTTPCRHFTLNRGWCPWGDDCCFIHDPALEWAPPPERGSSGRSTPSSMTLVGAGNYNKFTHNKNNNSNNAGTAIEPNTAPRTSSSQSAHCWGYIQGICPHPGDTCKYTHPENILPYIKYTPCLTWPRCGYPTQVCPLKHPQVDKLPTHTQPTLAQPQPQTAPYGTPPSLIIPHDAAYASAVQYHNPTLPSAETFSPPPARVAVRLSRPLSDVGRVEAVDQATAALGGLGIHHGRGRRVSIAVQGLHADLARGGALGYGKEYVRAHGRGKSMQL